MKKQNINKERMKFIKGYIKLLKKRDSELEIEVLEDVCYQLYTYGYVLDMRYLEYIKNKVLEKLPSVGESLPKEK